MCACILWRNDQCLGKFCVVQNRPDCVDYPAEVKDTFDVDAECRMKVLKVEIILVAIILTMQIIAAILQAVHGEKRLSFVTLIAGAVAAMEIGLAALPY